MSAPRLARRLACTALAVLVASPVSAQAYHFATMTRRDATSCATADSSYGPVGRGERLVWSQDRLTDSALVATVPFTRSGMAFGLRFEGDVRVARAAAAEAWSRVGLRVTAQNSPDFLRVPSVRVVLDDSLTVALPVRETAAKPGGIGLFTWHTVIADVPVPVLERMATARSIVWRVGALEGYIAESARPGMVALLRVLRCDAPTAAALATAAPDTITVRPLERSAPSRP